MKAQRISRRQFLKLSGFGAGALALPALGMAGVVMAPRQDAQAGVEHPNGPAIPQPTFAPVASASTFGPLTDVAMGWDGALRGIDAQGAPHIYDEVNDAWQPFGAGVDAAASNNRVLYLFRGSQFATFDLTTRQTSAPADIAAAWPALPDTFKLGVTGASYDLATQKLYLFGAGRYVPVDGSAPPKRLTDLANWPASDPGFGAGVIHGVFSALQSDGTTATFLLRGAQTLRVDLATATVTDAPQPFTNYYDYATFLPADFRLNGLDAGVAVLSPAPQEFTNYMYRGPALVTWSRGSPYPQVAQYIASAHPNWPATWNPVLLQAPSGRDGGLWSVVATVGYAAGTGQVIQHDGEAWAVPAPGTTATSVSAGQDGTVIHVQPDSGSTWRWTGTGWSPLGATPAQLQQISLGSSSEIWVRDVNNNVYYFDSATNAFTPSAIIGQASHIAATHDGTVWHVRPGEANAYRLLSGQNRLQPAIPVQQGIVTNASRVTGTGFGAAYCLAQLGSTPALYRYDSPYAFKSQYGVTPIAGSTLREALGAVYFTNSLDFSGTNFPVLALDAHTGVVRSQSAALPANATGPLGYTPPVFDPVNALIYVGVTQLYQSSLNNFGTGRIMALDARDLSTVVWSYDTPGYVANALTVIGTALIAGDRTGNVYLFDTVAARANPAAVAPTATWSLQASSGGAGGQDVWSLSEAVYLDDSYFAVAWDLTVATAYLVSFDAATPQPGGLTMLAAYDQGQAAGLNVDLLAGFLLATPPMLQQRAADATPRFAINAITQVRLVSAADGSSAYTFQLPARDDGSTAYIQGGLALDTDDNQLWFCDNGGRLYGLNTQFQAVGQTPITIASDEDIFSTPVVYRDTRGGKTVLTGVLQSQDEGFLYGFDPDTGNLASLVAGDTQITALSQGLSNGVLYAGGVSATVSALELSQLFALRVDDLVQATRDFIIESQLMQDPDETASNGSADLNDPIPPSVARYQTHISVVDDQKTPRANEPIKIWADLPGTLITIDGQQYTIGPGDDDYAQTQTGADGTVVVMSDADDINNPALRAWAGFMDPYERVLVYTDHEWHGRMMASYDDPNANAYRPDPTRPNLSTAHDYNGVQSQLFTETEKKSGFPGQVASAIAQMKAGVDPSSPGGAALGGGLKSLHAGNPAASYIAYSDLGGMHYAPINALAQRLAAVSAPLGLQFGTDAAGNITLATLSHSDAASAIDALAGEAWDPNNPDGLAQVDAAPWPSVPRRSESIFRSFWHWLKKKVKDAVTKVESVVVSAGEGISVGISFVVDGVKKVFKAAVNAVEDVVNAIGAFFLEFGKIIDDVIEALSLLFHFGEIMKTHRWIRTQITNNLNAAVDKLQNDVATNLTTFFNRGEQAILTAFQDIRNGLGISDDAQINDLSNARASAHTTFSAGAGGSSQAVPSMHALQKLKSGAPSATTQLPSAFSRPGAAPARPSDDVDDLGKFIASFVDDLQTDAALSAALSALQSALNGLTQPPSAGSFFKSALNALLSLVEGLIAAAVALTQRLADGLIGVIASLIQVMTDLLNAPIDIPFFSWLFKLLFNEDLTLLNLITLVVAIPVTFMYRVSTGRYPSQDGFSADSSVPAKAADDVTVIRIQGWLGATFAAGLGITRCINDGVGGDPDPVLTVFVVAFGVGYAVVYFPLFTQASPSGDQWATWGLGTLLALLGLLNLIPVPGGPTVQAIWKGVRLFLSIATAATRFVLYIVLFVEAGSTAFLTDLAFARNLFLELPTLSAWLKLIGGEAVWVLVGIDMLTMFAVGALDFALTLKPGEGAPLPRRQFLPWVSRLGAPGRIAPHPLVAAGR